MKSLTTIVALAALFVLPAAAERRAPSAQRQVNSLNIYFIDVEGGQATLIVTPTRQSLLVDGGWAGFEQRDPKRLLAAVHDAGLDHLDYLVATHFHGDHVGAIPALARMIPIRTFVDYDKPFDRLANVIVPYTAYAAARSRGRHLVPKPGDKIPLDGLDVTVLTTGGDALTTPIEGSAAPNAACASAERHGDDPGENRRSVGIRVAYGAFRFLDLGDLNWNPLLSLVCPTNLIGTADLFLIPHHSNSDAGVPALFPSVGARAVISNNSATKGGAADTFATLHGIQGLGDVWQLHRSVRDDAVNFEEARIANLDSGTTGYWIKVSAMSDGSFTVTNARNGVSKQYDVETHR